MWAMWKSCRGSTPWIGTTLGGWPSHYCCYPNSPDLAGFHVVHVFFVCFFTFLHQLLSPRDRPAAFPVNVTSIDDTKNFDEFPEVELNFSKFSSSSIFLGKLKKKMGQALNCNYFFRKTKQGRWWGGLQGLDVHELHFQKVNPISAS